ncbi:uncharacterized protein [Watersipora subatra]|uniref:uncharacterized protein n=1 Tax=Watersipora subatra TaxID=2589382 RepID=UPI00355C2F51
MPQFYKKKTDRYHLLHEEMKLAVQKVVEDKESLRSVSKAMNISRSTLSRYVEKYKANNSSTLTPNFHQRMLFSMEQETTIKEYLIDCSNRCYGLTREATRKFVYDLAKDNNIKMPNSWITSKAAGEKWLVGFMARNKKLSLRQPEATSIARAAAFTRRNVSSFFDSLEEVYKRTNVDGSRIFNLDESGFITVQELPKVISPRGQKQVGQQTSREKSELVTCCAIVNAVSNKLSPVLIFPRKWYNETFMNGAPEVSLGLTNTLTGSAWMTSDLFIRVAEHIIKHARPTKEAPMVLVMDNHASHCGYTVLKMCRDSGIHIVTLPPHTSNKTQPLDRTVFGPMTQYFNSGANSWQITHAGQPITIYQSAQLIGSVYTRACSTENIISGFKAAGIWPLNIDVFTDVDYLPSTVFQNVHTAPTPDQEQPSTSGAGGASDQQLSTSGAGGHQTSNLPRVVQVEHRTSYLL